MMVLSADLIQGILGHSKGSHVHLSAIATIMIDNEIFF